MTEASSIAERYIALWNEADPERRQTMIDDLWCKDGSYVDPLMQGCGHAEIDALVAGVQAQFPGFRFSLVGRPDGYGDHARFSWQLGPEGADGPIKGSDFVTVSDGRIKSVVGFLDQVPATA